MPAGFTLHGSPHSLYTYKVALMLRLCRVGFSFRYVSFQRGMHRMPEFRALSRWGQVPVLEHEGRTLTQSAAILEYLSETLGRFGGGDAEARQQIREWLFWNADRLSPPLFGWYGAELGRRGLLPIKFEPAVLARFDTLGAAALDAFDRHLAACDFLVGDAPTIADICSCGEIAFARMSGKEVAAWTNVTSWAARIEALPGWSGPVDLLPMHDVEVGP